MKYRYVQLFNYNLAYSLYLFQSASKKIKKNKIKSQNTSLLQNIMQDKKCSQRIIGLKFRQVFPYAVGFKFPKRERLNKF